MRFTSYGETDVGQARTHNEDYFFHDDELGLYVVADGMGGHARGEIASEQAVQSLVAMLKGGKDRIEDLKSNPNGATVRGVFQLFVSAVQAGSYMVHGISEQEPRSKGMGTTLTALLLVENLGFVVQVGDSRIYLVRKGKVDQLTEDHTLVAEEIKKGKLTEEEARFAPHANVITRAVGPMDYVEVDTRSLILNPGDTFILCTDGLHGYLNTQEIPKIVERSQKEECARNFIEIANLRGGGDNITVVVCFIE